MSRENARARCGRSRMMANLYKGSIYHKNPLDNAVYVLIVIVFFFCIFVFCVNNGLIGR